MRKTIALLVLLISFIACKKEITPLELPITNFVEPIEIPHVEFGFNFNDFDFNKRLFDTTDTELKAIAAAAIIGLSKKPLILYRTPAAIGIPIRLYINAQKRF